MFSTVFLAFSALGFAGGTPTTKDNSQLFVRPNETEFVTLRLINLEMETAEITVKNDAGEILLTRRINNQSAAVLKLDFSRMEAGNYKLYIDRSEKFFIQPLTITDNGVEVGAQQEIVKPSVKRNEEGFVVSNASKAIKSVSIVANGGRTVYHKSYDEKATKANAIQFKLAEVPNGNYIIRIETDFDVYYQDLNVQ